MSNEHLEHQANELAKAFAETINIERTKAKLEAFNIIRDGHDEGTSPYQILQDLLTWVGK
jgi:hypothetical protein